MLRKYKSNNVYVLEIHGCQYYIGAHTWKCKDEMTEANILNDSFNPLMKALRKNLITRKEYKDCCRIVHIEEFDSKEEAENREAELIEKFKSYYGDQCLNQSKGNKYGKAGLTPSEETRRKMSESQLNTPKKSKSILQFDLNGNFIKEYPSISEASRQTGISDGNISSCLTGRHKSAGRSIWEYA